MKRHFVIIIVICLSLIQTTLAMAQSIVVKGKVVDEKGEPLTGVGVVDKANIKNGVVTNLDGTYQIKIAADGFLEFSSLGFTTALEQVKGRTQIDVRMIPAVEDLEKVVVIGYGTSKKSDLTGSVAVVDMSDLKDRPVNSIGQALQGKVAGAEFMSQNGEPGESGTIQVRGSRSISAGNQPLIVVDGVPDAVTDLGDINPSDIVSISILKDVSSTAIYGSRGANGVILITTHDADKTSNNKFDISFTASAGASRIAGGLDIMNAKEYAHWRNMVAWQQYKDSGKDVSAYTPPYNEDSYGKGTDWVKALSQTSLYQDYHFRLSGGNSDTHYTFGLGYLNNRGVVIGSGMKRYSGLLNLTGKLNRKISWGITLTYIQQAIDHTNASIGGTNTSSAIYLSPLLTINDTWNKYGDSDNSGGSVFNNPYICAKQITNEAVKRTTDIVPWLRYRLNSYLYAQGKFSYAYNADFSGYYSPSTLPVAAANKTGGTAVRSDYKKEFLLGEFTLNYKRKVRGSEWTGLLGWSGEKETIDNARYSGTGYVDDALGYNNMGGIMDMSSFSPATSNLIRTKMSGFSRLDYSYRHRYFATATVRADGASNFASGRKWGFFPALALRWSLSNEKFLKDAYWINDLSLRLSAGRSGNDAVASYMSLATLTVAQSDWMFGEGSQLVYVPKKLHNSNLTWETTDAYNLGLNFTAFRNRVNLEADAYVSYTNDLLLSMRNSSTTGYSLYFDNAGKTQNIGFELTLDTKNVQKNNFKWETSLTFSHNKQTVVDIGSGDEVVPTYMNPASSTQYMYGYRKSYPVNALWGYKYGGVWHNEDEIERNKLTHTYVSVIQSGANGTGLGRPKYVDVNHDGLLNEKDQVYLGSSDAVAYGGFQNNFTIYRKFHIGLYFVYSIGGKIYNLSELRMGSGVSSFNKYRYMLNAWDSDERPNSDICIPGYHDSMASDRMVYDASYLRLKSLSFSYDVPVSRIFKGAKSINVGISGENLWLTKKYPGFDPDVNSSSLVYRLDNGSFPRPRTVVFNLEIKF